jgi:DNA-binding phage protein
MALKTTKFDVQDHLKTLEEQITYLEAAIDEDDRLSSPPRSATLPRRAESASSPRKPG